MEATNSQSAAILQIPHPSRLLWMFPACQVCWVTHSPQKRLHQNCCGGYSGITRNNTHFVWGVFCTGSSSGGISPTRKEQPLFTLRQVGMICERLLKEREEKVREEYEETMTSKLAGWYTVSRQTQWLRTVERSSYISLIQILQENVTAQFC